jgi:hypothetical protein
MIVMLSTDPQGGVGDRLYEQAMKTLEKRKAAWEEAKKRKEKGQSCYFSIMTHDMTLY